MKEVEYGLKVETGFIKDESKFYTGFCAALNTNNGHVVMIATTIKELEIQSKLVINSDFELNDDMVSRVGLCKEKHITKTECKEKEMKSDRLADEIMEKGKDAVYTQEMKDNNDLPRIGMMVGLRFNDVSRPTKGRLIVLTNDYIILLVDGGQEQHYHRKTWSFEAIDQRTDSEKAIDDIDLFITDTNNSLTGTYKLERNFSTESIALLQKIKAGEVCGVSFTGDKK